MRELYELVNKTLEDINFNELWYGFKRVEFALYDDKNVYLKDCNIPYDNRFLGNTRINYEGSELAIWNVENGIDIDYLELSSNIVHEMFHSYQITQNESRFPDDISALSYTNILENYLYKHNENIILVGALNSTDRREKMKLLKQIIASRKLRVAKFGELIKYEFAIETIEGSAEYVGTKALKHISMDLYRKRIERYKKLLVEDKKILFDIRRCSYFTGTLFLLLLDQVGIEFSKEISNEKLTISEQISNLIDTNNIVTENIDYLVVKENFEEERLRKEKLINDFFTRKPSLEEGEFYICGYDPMNMFKVDDKIFCSHFIMLKNIETNESIFVKGPTVIQSKKDSDAIKGYYL